MQGYAVKYDRPVWQIMHMCADAMPDIFRYENVREWFTTHYPAVNEATIRAHLIGLTEGGRAKHVQFAQRSPVFRRLARGEYASIPLEERGEDPNVEAPSTSGIKMNGLPPLADKRPPAEQVEPEPEGPAPATADATPSRTGKSSGKKPGSKKAGAKKTAKVPTTSESSDEGPPAPPDIILLGSIGDRVNVPAPAKEVFREVGFQLSRLDAELSGAEWFVLSAEHGLVAPNEWMSPDSRTLADMDPGYRVVWASWVVARLSSLVGALEGMTVRVDAPDAFIGPLFADLQETGAIVSSGHAGAGMPPLSGQSKGENVLAEHLAEALATPKGHGREPDVGAAAVRIDPASPVSIHLADVSQAISADDLTDLPEVPGLYGWHVDPIGARELNRCLMLPIRAGLIFVGQVGGSSWQSLADPVLNLRDHVQRIQMHGQARASTFRMTLATVLREHLRMASLEDPRLTEWMREHLSITVWPSDDFGGLRELEHLVVNELDPPLNVDHLPASEYRARLNQMRSALG